jgi:1,4-alpha-glucan branching enzyme
MLTAEDVYLFREGTHGRLYRKLGCHLAAGGAHFGVWAPNARSVTVVGEWNGWRPDADALAARPDGSGIWEGFVSRVAHGHAYKFHVVSQSGDYAADKADPFAVYAEVPPGTASRAWSADYQWGDAEWMRDRSRSNGLGAPISIYEVHLGSWRRADDGGYLGYRAAAEALAGYVRELGFTHVELLPLPEHPF